MLLRRSRHLAACAASALTHPMSTCPVLSEVLAAILRCLSGDYPDGFVVAGVIRPGVSCTASSGDAGQARRARLLGCGPGRGAGARLAAAASVRSRGMRWSGARPSLRLVHEDAAHYRRQVLGASTPPAACARAAPPPSRRREAALAPFAISSIWRSIRPFRESAQHQRPGRPLTKVFFCVRVRHRLIFFLSQRLAASFNSARSCSFFFLALDSGPS